MVCTSHFSSFLAKVAFFTAHWLVIKGTTAAAASVCGSGDGGSGGDGSGDGSSGDTSGDNRKFRYCVHAPI